MGSIPSWAYTHVPSGSTFDATDRIESQIERFAPGFRDRILAKHTHDFGGACRRTIRTISEATSTAAFRTSARRLPGQCFAGTRILRRSRDCIMCSASTPPGGGVHGMCGYHAARSALRELF